MGLYLQGADLDAFGVAGATSPQIQQASSLIDGFTARPEGLTFTGLVMDNTGAPIVEILPPPKRPSAPVNVSRPNVATVISVETAYPNSPAWQAIDPASYGFNSEYGFTFSGWYFPQRMRFTFLAGWEYANLPAIIKQACANIIIAQATFPSLNGNIQSLKTGAASVTRFKDTLLDADTIRMIGPFCRVYSV